MAFLFMDTQVKIKVGKGNIKKLCTYKNTLSPIQKNLSKKL